MPDPIGNLFFPDTGDGFVLGDNPDLADFQEFILVLEGEEKDLPADLLQLGNYPMFDNGDLLMEELLVLVGTSNGQLEMLNMALLHTSPIVGIPEPASLILLALGALLLLGRRQRPR